MKKLVFLLLFLSAITFIYAQEQQANNFDFGFTCLVAMSNGRVAPGPGLAISWNNTQLFGQFGMGTYLNIVAPIIKKTVEEGNNYGLVASMLLGPSYMTCNNGVLSLPVTVGMHFNVVVPISSYVETGLMSIALNLGIGANADFVWNFSEKWHAYARIMTVFNIAALEFLILPGLGMGFSF